MVDLNQDQKKKLKRLFEDQNYSKFESQVEKLGLIEDLPIYLKMGYAGSKTLNPNSERDDFLNASIIFEKIYSKNKSNLEALYNLILSSLKAEICSYVLPHLLDFYEKNKKDPKIVEGLARIYFQLDNMDFSVKFFKKLIDLNPISTIDGGRLTYLATMNYPSNINQKDYYNECIKLGDVFEKYSKFPTFVDKTSLNKKVKIGFLSGDFRDHSVNFFLKDVIEKIDKKKFYIVGLSNLELKRHHEVITKFYQNQFDEWHDVIDYNDEKLVDFVRSLNLDILIDLNGFTFGNRLNIFAARSAKKQISWCGYNNSLGIKNMDYLIADKNLIKKDEEKYYKEKIIYMPKIWNAMSKPENLPEINDLPFEKNDIFRFGSFNSFKKISDDVIKVWSKIVNNSNCELYLKNSGGYNKEIYDNLLKRFENENADLKKIIFLKKSKSTEFMKDYYKIDLALDTFPYTGVTTSFQSYLMGVPVLTLKGFNMNSRCGESINSNLGLNDFIADNFDDYYKKSISLQDKNKLSNLRSTLRNKILSSSLFDTDNFVKDLMSVFEKILKQ
jgi:predicted O-linked N-acetylglucosamine transferase (SPINDLY family)